MALGEATAKSWLLVIIAWVILQSSTLRADTIPLDLTSSDKGVYSTFLTNVRTKVADPKLVYGGTTIPVIGKPTNTFLRIDLKVSDGTVSLGLLKNNLYVVSYLAKNDEGKFVAYYFENLITAAQVDSLFPEAKGVANKKTIKEYKENYASLETAAKETRKKAGLGINKLVTYIGGVNGIARKVPNEAKFLMVAIQMVSEAARFGYIEKMVLDNFPNGFTPDDKVFIYERNWDRISTAIKGSNRGVFSKELVLTWKGTKTKITANKAADLNMKLLMYLGNLVYHMLLKGILLVDG